MGAQLHRESTKRWIGIETFNSTLGSTTTKLTRVIQRKWVEHWKDIFQFSMVTLRHPVQAIIKATTIKQQITPSSRSPPEGLQHNRQKGGKWLRHWHLLDDLDAAQQILAFGWFGGCTRSRSGHGTRLWSFGGGLHGYGCDLVWFFKDEDERKN